MAMAHLGGVFDIAISGKLGPAREAGNTLTRQGVRADIRVLADLGENFLVGQHVHHADNAIGRLTRIFQKP